jgi:trans-aconitate 2-methyltransferase
VPKWDADQYLKFGRERTQPSVDLVSRIDIENPRRIIDLGCGPGNSTAILHGRWPDARITGLDSSAEMIAQASETDPNIDWRKGNIAEWEPGEDFDIIFSNAAYQWLGDHGTLFEKLVTHLSPAGVFAAQLPYHYASPLNQVMIEVSGDPAWDSRMEPARNALTHETAGFYYDTLRPTCARIEIWETEYYHNLANPQAIVEFIRGTGLRPFMEALESDAEKSRFEREVLAGYTRSYPEQADGTILFPFRRQFVIGYRE